MKEDKSILRTIREANVLVRRLTYDFLKQTRIIKLIYPYIKQPWKKMYERDLKIK